MIKSLIVACISMFFYTINRKLLLLRDLLRRNKMESRIDCLNIHKLNCEYCTNERLCPDNCKGFVSINGTITGTLYEEVIEEKPVFSKKYK